MQIKNIALLLNMNIPMGYGRGHIGRKMLKTDIMELLNEFKELPKHGNGCFYDEFALAVHRKLLKATIEYKLKNL